MQRGLQILLLISMLPGMLTGIGADRVLCIGPDGHMAVEPAMLCSQVTCASVASDDHLGGQPLQQPAFTSSVDCGRCTDVPGASSLGSASRGHKASVQTLAQPVPFVTMPLFAASKMEGVDTSIRPADTPIRGCTALLRTAVLLI